jgi:pilus assembly protein CpaF
MSLLKRLQKEGSISGETVAQSVPRDNTFWNLKFSLHQQVVEKLEQEISGETDKVSEEEREQAANQIKEIMAEHLLEKGISMSRNEQQRMLQELLDEVFELGPISPLLRDETVSEVMVNGPSQVYVERNGVLEETEVQFRDDAHVARVMEKIVSPLGRRIDESSPMVDARLSDGSRVNAVIPPLTLNGPTLTIRKFSKDPYKIDDLIRFGTLSGEMAKFIEACVKAPSNTLNSLQDLDITSPYNPDPGALAGSLCNHQIIKKNNTKIDNSKNQEQQNGKHQGKL